jgi:3-hydroxyacyl-[acyl-carrier-protein] dehydratase
MTINNAKFRKLVQPGDVLKLKVLVERNRGNTWKFSGNAFVEDNLVTEANFTAMMIEN